jgi:hypothetical protein
MRWSLLAVKLCIVAVYLVLIGILVLTVVPLIQGGMDVEVPESNQVNWSYENGIITSDVTIGIYNGGVLDIEDCRFRADSTVDNGSFITSSQSSSTNLKAKEWTYVTIPLTFNVNELTRIMEQDVVYNGATVNITLDLSTYVALRLIHFELSTPEGQSFEIPALISNVQVDMNQASIVPYGDGYALSIPYSFDASSLIVGKTISLHGGLRNETDGLGSVDRSLTIQQHNSEDLIIPVSNETATRLMTEPDTLNFEVGLNFQGNEFTRTYSRDWQPPSVRMMLPSDNSLTVQPSFTMQPQDDPLMISGTKGWSL